MEDNLILEGLLSMVTELKEKQEAQVTPASREETLERLDVIERTLSELRRNPVVPEKELRDILNQLADLQKSEQEQRQSFGDVRKYVVATFRCLKEMLETMERYRAENAVEKEENKPVPFYRRMYDKAASLIHPRLFLFSAGLIVCATSLERLENKFKWQRDEHFIRNLRDSVLDFEERCRRQAEALERARLLNEQAEQLKKEADRLGNP